MSVGGLNELQKDREMTDQTQFIKNWRKLWLCSIEEFADYETQRQIWLNRENTNPHFSFVEYMSCYFDDLSLSDRGYSWALTEGYVSKEEHDAVARFHKIADTYDAPANDNYDHAAILNDPAWEAVVLAAQAAQRTLETLLDDPDEKTILTGEQDQHRKA